MKEKIDVEIKWEMVYKIHKFKREEENEDEHELVLFIERILLQKCEIVRFLNGADKRTLSIS